MTKPLSWTIERGLGKPFATPQGPALYCKSCDNTKLLTDFTPRPEVKMGYKKECISCTSLRSKRDYSKNMDKVLTRSAERYENNREEILASRKKFREENREHCLAISAKSREKNRPTYRANRRADYARDPSRVYAWNAIRRQRKVDQTPVDLSKEDKRKMRDYYALSKALSKWSGVPHVVDHIHPLSKGGSNSPDNLQILTAKINAEKADKIDYVVEGIRL